MVLVPPTRSIQLERRRPPPKRHASRASRVQMDMETITSSWTTQSVAVAFGEQINAVSCNLQSLAEIIVSLKQQLSFSSVQFARTVLHTLERAPCTPWPLMAYHRLAKLTHGAVRLDTLLLAAQPDWLLDQYRLLRKEDHDMFRDYVAEMITILLTDHFIPLDKIHVRQCMVLLFPAEDDLGDVSAVLHDPNKLRFLTAEERRGFAMTQLNRMVGFPAVDLVLAKVGAVRDLSLDAAATRVALCAQAEWFCEFGNSRWPLFFDYALERVSEEEEPYNYAYLFRVYGAACHALSESGQESVRAIVLLDTAKQRLTDDFAAVLSSKKSFVSVSLTLALVQITLHYLGESLGLRYPKWFHATFVDPATRVITSKRSGQAFVQTLSDMIMEETPAVLQMHAKSLSNLDDDLLSLAPQYVAAAKTRLLELGLDHSLRQYPVSIAAELTTNPAAAPQTIEDAIVDALTAFQQTRTISRKLWEDSIFRARWFKVTFLPALLAWKPPRPSSNANDRSVSLADVRDELVTVLKDKGKIPDPVYRNFITQSRPSS